MAYGLEINNQYGRSVIEAGELAFFYAGKVTINHVHGVADYKELGGVDVNTPVIGFCVTETPTTNPQFDGAAWGTVDLALDNGVIKRYVISSADAPTGTFTIYLFTTIDKVPREEYGLEMYDTDGSLQFNTTRPLLVVRDFYEYYKEYTSNFYVTNFSPPKALPKKLAVCTRDEGVTLTYGAYLVYNNVTCWKNPNNNTWYVGVSTKRGRQGQLSVTPPPGRWGADLGLIDASYYDQFDNMPNFF